MKLWKIVTTAGIFFIAAANAIAAEDAASPLTPGDRVTVIERKAQFYNGSKVVGPAATGATLIVDRLEGGEVRFAGQSGSLRLSEVIAYDRAEAYFDSAVARDGTAYAFHDRASFWAERDEPKKAVADYSEALRLSPHHPVLHFNRAQVWEDLGEFEKAVADYDESIESDPEFALAYNARGRIRHRQQSFGGALADSTRAIALEPDRGAFRANRGLSLRLLGELDRAETDAEAAIHLAPQEPFGYTCRGLVHYSRGKLDAAIADLDEAIRLAPGDANSYENRGAVWHERGDTDRAIADLVTALRLNPKLLVSRNNLAVAYEERGEFGNAIAEYGKVVELAPEQSIPLNSLAWLLATCPDGAFRNGKRAVELATRASKLTDHSDAETLRTLAAAHAATGDFAAAVRVQEQALELAPDDKKSTYRDNLSVYRDGKAQLESPPSAPE